MVFNKSESESGAYPGFEKRGGPKYLMYPCSVFEVGGGAWVLHPCQPSVIRTETPSFWRLQSLSFEGHLEKQN